MAQKRLKQEFNFNLINIETLFFSVSRFFVFLLCFGSISGFEDAVCNITIETRQISQQTFKNITTCKLVFLTSISHAGKTLNNSRNENVSEFRIEFGKNVEFMLEDLSKTFPNLDTMYVYDTSVKSLTKNNFYGLNKLKSLLFVNGILSSLDEDSFDDLESLNSLDLYYNEISSLPANIFSKLLNLYALGLNNNKLINLDARSFKNNHNLRSLGLAYNKLRSFEIGLFDTQTNLVNLFLYNNEISTLQPNIFAKLEKLQMLEIFQNAITSIPNDLLSNSVELEEVNFSNNSLTFIDFSMFAKNLNLKRINLRDMKIERILNIEILDQLKLLEDIDFRTKGRSCISGSYFVTELKKLKKDVKNKC